jgi:hypothetical protein
MKRDEDRYRSERRRKVYDGSIGFDDDDEEAASSQCAR